jgi:DNA-binding transcriptional LysR family regulator
MQLDPRRMLTFRAVARHGSFSRAAAELSLTQSAVSQQVAALEKQIGVRLMHRGRGGVQLTAAGERLLEHAAALAERMQLAGVQLGELAAKEGQELRVGAFPSALATIVPAALTRLLAREPGLQVGLREGRTQDLAAAVRSGELHAAVCFQDARTPRVEPAGTRRRELGEEPMLVALPPRHRLHRRRSVRLAELADDPWLAATPDGLIANASRAAGFEPRITILTSDPLASAALVAAGLAVTLTPGLLATHGAGARAVPVADRPPRRSLYLLLPDSGARELDLALATELEQAVTT